MAAEKTRRIQFTRDFDWSPPEHNGRVTLSYKSGTIVFARAKCADDAIAAGAAKPVTKAGAVESHESR